MNNIINPKVSIGLPVYNGELFLEDALNSLICQSFKDFEIIISDNNSNDNTSAICSKFIQIDSRIKYFKQTEQIDIMSNFNFVLQNSIGEYFMWAASDDYWSNKHIEYCVEILNTNQNAIASITKTKCGPSSKSSCGDFTIESRYTIVRRYKYLLNPGPNARFYSLYRKEFLKKLKICNYNFFASDWAIIFDLLKYGDFIQKADYVGFCKRQHSEAESNIKKIISNLKKEKNGNIYFPMKSFLNHLINSSLTSAFIYLPVIIYQNLQCFNWFLHDLYFRKKKYND